MSNPILAILREVKQTGNSLQIFDGQLKLKTKKGAVISPELLTKVKSNKQAIKQLLEQDKASKLGKSPQRDLPISVSRNQMEEIPLSYSQESLWFVDKLEGTIHYHMIFALKLEGPLDVQAFKQSWQILLTRHEVLRTIILSKQGKPFQKILSVDDWQVQDVQSEGWTEEQVMNWIGQESQRPFDLSKDYMIRVHLLKLAPERYGLLIVLHHIAGDGWSLSVLGDEFSVIYRSLTQKSSLQLAPLPIQYADYAIWQREYLSGDTLGRKLKWWTDRLSGVPPIDLPLDFPRPTIQSTKGGSYDLLLDPQLTQQIMSLSQRVGATLYMTLLAVFKVLLYRYSGQSDICVGTSVANRGKQELESLIGFFVNSLALRSDLSGNPTFEEVLVDLRNSTFESFQYQDVPIDMVVEQVVKKRDLSYRPLFQVLFVLQNTPSGKSVGLDDELTIKGYPVGEAGAKFDLLVNVLNTKAGILLGFGYCSDLFKEETIRRMAFHFERLLKAIISNPQVRIDQLPMIGEEERYALLRQFNDTSFAYPKTHSILDLIEDRVRTQPNASAIVLQDEVLSYKELVNKSHRIAQELLEQGLQKEDLVGVYLDRSLELIPSMLGVLKAGGTFVPLDPEYPVERISQILEDCQPKWLLSRSVDSMPQDLEIQLIDIDELSENSSMQIEFPELQGSSLAYVMYTSGSTGKPKGVMIEHHSLLDYSLTFQEYFGLNETDKVIQQASFSFDTMIEEVFPALISGASMIMIKEGGRDVATISSYIEEGEATILSTTPLVLAWLAKQLPHTGNLRYVISGGDLLLADHIQQFFGKVPIVNSYGPTEATVCATYHTIEQLKESSLIGKPIRNREIYILSPTRELQAIGVAGEIYIGGAGLARGYWGNEKLTAAQFVEHPFKPGERLYRTGDVGKWLADGTIAFLGRVDEQVKIRGYRVELGEIESVLSKANGVKDCVLRAVLDPQGLKQIAAYIVGEEEVSKQDLQAYLRQLLPAYMIPTYWTFLEKLPLLPNGKIDKKSLPEPDFTALSSNTYIAPSKDTESKLASIWQDLMSVERVGLNDNFFELGGHSLLALQAISEIKVVFNIELSVRALFETADLQELARLIDQMTLEVEETVFEEYDTVEF